MLTRIQGRLWAEDAEGGSPPGGDEFERVQPRQPAPAATWWLADLLGKLLGRPQRSDRSRRRGPHRVGRPPGRKNPVDFRGGCNR